MRIDAVFGAIGRFAVRFRWLVVLVMTRIREEARQHPLRDAVRRALSDPADPAGQPRPPGPLR